MAQPTVTTRKDSEMEEEREEPGLVEEGEVEVGVRVGVEGREERRGGNPVPAVLMLIIPKCPKYCRENLQTKLCDSQI
jgi:hypothetical protein